MKIKTFFNKNKKTLVLSGGGFKGVYTLGILKGLEELGIDQEIESIFGVSIGAIIGALRANGIKAEDIFKLLESSSIENLYSKDIFKKTGGLFSNKKIEEILKKNLPNNFSELEKKIYIGTTDTYTAEYILWEKGDLIKIILGSMAIPGIFPPIKYNNHLLVDGGVLNNFPVDIAKEKYPKNKIIGISLHKFEKKDEIKTIFDNILVMFEIVLRAKLYENTKKVDYLFHKKVPISTLSLDKRKMKKLFELGYNDCLTKFKNKNIK